jgi:hypothetical protein
LSLQVWHISHLGELNVEKNIELGEDLVVATRFTPWSIFSGRTQAIPTE